MSELELELRLADIEYELARDLYRLAREASHKLGERVNVLRQKRDALAAQVRAGDLGEITPMQGRA